jgi:hypothetical protein
MPESVNKNEPKPFTHTAWILKTELMRRGRRIGRRLECGVGRVTDSGDFEGYLDRLPVGGWDGRVYFAKIGNPPPDLEAPQRPGTDSDDDGADEE